MWRPTFLFLSWVIGMTLIMHLLNGHSWLAAFISAALGGLVFSILLELWFRKMERKANSQQGSD